MSKRLVTTEEWIKRAINIHYDEYLYTKTKYTASKAKLIITCKIHGDFEQLAYSHLNGRGCNACASIKRAATQKLCNKDFIMKAKSKHLERYNYSKTLYTGAKNKVIITCSKHGDFEQTADNHLKGQGCSKCNVRGWSRTEYINFSPVATLYVIECYNKTERFIKVGITIQSINDRFKNSLPYEYKTLMTIEGDSGSIYDFETTIHRSLKEYQYTPKKHFGGYTECFIANEDIKNIIKNKSFNNEENNASWRVR